MPLAGKIKFSLVLLESRLPEAVLLFPVEPSFSITHDKEYDLNRCIPSAYIWRLLETKFNARGMRHRITVGQRFSSVGKYVARNRHMAFEKT